MRQPTRVRGVIPEPDTPGRRGQRGIGEEMLMRQFRVISVSVPDLVLVELIAVDRIDVIKREIGKEIEIGMQVKCLILRA